MTLCVVGKDEKLREICNALVNSDPKASWEIVQVDREATQWPNANMCIWDFETAGCPEPSRLNSLAHCILVVEWKNLAALRERADRLGIAILLKPVNLRALGPFVELALAEQRLDARLARSRTERDDLLQCLLQANLELQDFDHSRTNFLARALHDFRAPLTALNGYCGLLLDGQVGPLNANQVELVARMRHSLLRITRMVSGMFDLSVRHQVKQELRCQRAEIGACIAQAAHEIAPLADEKNIRLLVSSEPGGADLAFEPAKIEQVLINLLENACKFTPRFGSIQVSGYPVFWDTRVEGHTGEPSRWPERAEIPNAYRIDVRDSGPGIPSDCLESIFEEYTSYPGGHDRSGGGLGLAICRMIVTQHRGSIWAQSSQAGACLSFVLPSMRTGASACVPADVSPRAVASRAASV